MENKSENIEELDKLLGDLYQAKQKEQEFRDFRIDIENKIINLIGIREEGSQTTKAIHFKTRITSKLSRKVDWEKYDLVINKTALPSNELPVKISRSLDLKKLKVIESKYPESYRDISDCITIAPLKPQVTCEQIED